MTKLLARDVEPAFLSLDDFYWDDAAWGLPDNLDVHGEEYHVEVVDSSTGDEGDWDIQTFIVLRVGEQLFRKTGHYMSHYGNDWDGEFVEVEAYKRTVNDYREVER